MGRKCHNRCMRLFLHPDVKQTVWNELARSPVRCKLMTSPFLNIFSIVKTEREGNTGIYSKSSHFHVSTPSFVRCFASWHFNGHKLSNASWINLVSVKHLWISKCPCPYKPMFEHGNLPSQKQRRRPVCCQYPKHLSYTLKFVRPTGSFPCFLFPTKIARASASWCITTCLHDRQKQRTVLQNRECGTTRPRLDNGAALAVRAENRTAALAEKTRQDRSKNSAQPLYATQCREQDTAIWQLLIDMFLARIRKKCLQTRPRRQAKSCVFFNKSACQRHVIKSQAEFDGQGEGSVHQNKTRDQGLHKPAAFKTTRHM